MKKRFADSPVTLVGYGSNAEYHAADAQEVKDNIELTKKYVDLMADCGGSGVKVKPNGFPKDVSREKTIEQIGKALNVVDGNVEMAQDVVNAAIMKMRPLSSQTSAGKTRRACGQNSLSEACPCPRGVAGTLRRRK